MLQTLLVLTVHLGMTLNSRLGETQGFDSLVASSVRLHSVLSLIML